MLKVYGLKNCDTCRKARKWLDANGTDYSFADLRSDGFDPADVARWAAAAGWETLLNRRGTTWRGLDDSQKELAGADEAVSLMVAHPALMKRPVFDFGEDVIVGFAAAQQKQVEQKL